MDPKKLEKLYKVYLDEGDTELCRTILGKDFDAVHEYHQQQMLGDHGITVFDMYMKSFDAEELSEEFIKQMIEGIYLAFPGYSGKKPAVYPFDSDNSYEIAAAKAYYEYVRYIHGSSEPNILKVEECEKTFENPNNYKDPIPGFEAMNALGSEFLKRITWSPELWTIEPYKTYAKKAIQIYQGLVAA